MFLKYLQSKAGVNSRINGHALSASLCPGPEAQERARRTLPSPSTCPAKKGAAQAACGSAGSGRRGDLISWRGGVREARGAPFTVPSFSVLCAPPVGGRGGAALGSSQTPLLKTQFGKKGKPSLKSLPTAVSDKVGGACPLCRQPAPLPRTRGAPSLAFVHPSSGPEAARASD